MPSDLVLPPRSRRFGRFLAELLVVFAIFGWWLTSCTLPDGIFPSPFGVATVLGQLLVDPDFWPNAGATALRVTLAVAIATPLGTMLGVLPRYVPAASGVVEDILIPFFGAFPSIIWAILGTVWFGVTSTAVVIVQMLIVMPFCLVNVSEGAKNIPSEEVEMGHSFGRDRLALFWRIELPYLSPYVLAGARIAYGVCWKISLIAELFGARSGLGFMLQQAQDLNDPDTILAICLIIVAFVVLGEWLILRPLATIFDIGAGPVKPALGALAIYAASARRLATALQREAK